MKLLIFLSLIAASTALRVKSDPVDRNNHLFKHSKTDEYTLPEDIEDNKPPTVYQGDVKEAKILASQNKNHGKGKFKYSLRTQNGIELDQVGKLKDENTFAVSGSYSYTGSDGRRYRVRYTADELGYHPITELDFEIPDLMENMNTNSGFQFLKSKLDDTLKSIKDRIKQSQPNSKQNSLTFGKPDNNFPNRFGPGNDGNSPYGPGANGPNGNSPYGPGANGPNGNSPYGPGANGQNGNGPYGPGSNGQNGNGPYSPGSNGQNGNGPYGPGSNGQNGNGPYGPGSNGQNGNGPTKDGNNGNPNGGNGGNIHSPERGNGLNGQKPHNNDKAGPERGQDLIGINFSLHPEPENSLSDQPEHPGYFYEKPTVQLQINPYLPPKV